MLAGRSAHGEAQHGEAQHGESAAVPGCGRRALRAMVLAVAVLCGASALAAAPAAEAPAAIQDLAAERDGIAADLAATIARCVARRDTRHPAFHGCIDWHSAVHGVWALVAYTRATGDARYRPLLDAVLQPAAIAAERRALDADARFEMPYGRAWFLRLALEHAGAFGSTALTDMADAVARSLVGHYAATRADPLAPAYDNPSWALVNLLDYAAARRDAALGEAALGIVRRDLGGEAPCPAGADAGEFIGVCTTWAWLIARAFGPDELRRRLGVQFAAVGRDRPVARPAGPHEAGLNFSRAWGLWEIWRATGDPAWAELYAAHVRATYARRADWAGRYETVAHWVAQFGMFALMPLYPGRSSRSCGDAPVAGGCAI